MDQALEQELWTQPQWHRLMHYEKPVLSFGVKSAISSQEFFLAKDGRTNPKAELLANLERLIIRTNKKDQCRFPARYIWLTSIFKLKPELKCSELEKWTRKDTIKSISIVFASGYLSNPASYFGHPLIKINFRDNGDKGSLLSSSINYGALTPKQENPILYIFKGLLGGYNAAFTRSVFYYPQYNYAEMELRDLWEYELKLTPKQVQLLTYHLWELERQKYPYYFLSDNCAYRIGEILEFVTKKEFFSKYGFYRIPSSLFHRISELKLAKEPVLLESRQTRFSKRYLTLKRDERQEFSNYLDQSPLSNDLSQTQKIKVLETAIAYYSFKKASDRSPKEESPERRRSLIDRATLPNEDIEWKKPNLIPPHIEQRPTGVSLKTFHSSKFGFGQSLAVRPAFNDYLSYKKGLLPTSKLIVGSFEISHVDQEVWLNNLTFFSVSSLNFSNSGISPEGGLAWEVDLSYTDDNQDCVKCQAMQLQLGVGKAIRFDQRFGSSFFLKLLARGKSELGQRLAVIPTTDFFMTPANWLRVFARIDFRQYFSGAEREQWRTSMGLSFLESKKVAIEIRYSKWNSERFEGGLSYYW